ncbi:hypothetical protein ACLMJK_000088 [Lecanora helva]
MPFALHPYTKEDAQDVAQVTIASFKNNPFRSIVFPNGMGQASLQKIVDSQVKAVDDPTKFPLKVIETNTGEMAACALWIRTKAMSDDDWQKSRGEAMKAYPDARMDLLGHFILKSEDAKERIMKDREWWELESLSTLPKYQRQGIGSMVMEWGNRRQEEVKLPGFIQATDQGFGLYAKHGYVEKERWEFDLGNWSDLGGSGMYKNVFLVRDLPDAAIS